MALNKLNLKSNEFPEIWTHENALKFVRDFIRKWNGEILKHRYYSHDPEGTINVEVGGNHVAIPYGLPEDPAMLERMCIAALEPYNRWKEG